MKLRYAAVFVLLALCLASAPAGAGPEMYLLGGIGINKLGPDAELFGDVIADGMTNVPVDGALWVSKKGSKTGLDVGLGFRYASSVGIGGNLEFRYATRGVKWNFTEVTGVAGSFLTVKSSLKSNYIEIPLLLEYTAPLEGPVAPTLLAGPVLGIRASTSFAAEGVAGGASADFGDFMKSTYFGTVLGAGVKLRASEKVSVLVQGRYLIGLSNILDEDQVFVFVPGDIQMKPRDLSVLAGVSFGL